MFIVIEGIDGGGKSTVADRLHDCLDAELIHFPDDKAVTGPAIREYLAKKWWLDQPYPYEQDRQREALVFQALQVANRVESFDRIVRADQCAMARGDRPHLIAVRYWQSGWVYGQIDGLSSELLCRMMHPMMHHGLLHILLDVPPEVAMARIVARGGAVERYEAKLELLAKARTLYRELWRDHKLYVGARRCRYVVIDAGIQSIDAVVEECCHNIDALFDFCDY